VIKPAPGRDAVKPTKPDWCEAGHETNPCDGNCQKRTITSAIENQVGGGLDIDLRRVAELSCDFPDSAYVQQQVAYWRQDFINATGLSEKESRDALKLAADHAHADDAKERMCKAVAPSGPVETARYNQQRAVSLALGCESDFTLAASGNPAEHIAWLDRADLATSQIARAAYVLDCTPDHAAASFANCVGDAAHLDRAKLDAEIAALKLNPLGRVRALEVFGVARLRAERAQAEIAKDQKLAKVIDAAKAAFDGWEASVYKPNQALFTLAYAIEDKASEIDPNDLGVKPLALGCEPLRKGLRDYVAAQHPKDKQAVLAAYADPVAYPLLARLALCDGAEGRHTTAQGELQVLRSQHRYRHGARTAAHWAAFDAALDSNRAVDPATIPSAERDTADHAIWLASFAAGHGAPEDWLSPLDEPTGDEGTERSHVIEVGKIASIKKTAGGVLVTFKKERWTEASWECKPNGRIMAFERDGTPIASRDCKVVGSHQVTFQLEPRIFDAGSAIDALQVGQVIKCVSAGEKEGDAAHALLMEIDKPGVNRKGLMPGVRALLDALAPRDDVYLALLTGNYEEGARLKLEYFDLWNYFSCGAFGDDAPHRNVLVPKALTTVAACGGPAFAAADAIVIGDTPLDVGCAIHAGARSLGVATGSHSVEQLQAAGADAVLKDLSDTAEVLGIIGLRK